MTFHEPLTRPCPRADTSAAVGRAVCAAVVQRSFVKRTPGPLTKRALLGGDFPRSTPPPRLARTTREARRARSQLLDPDGTRAHATRATNRSIVARDLARIVRVAVNER